MVFTASGESLAIVETLKQDEPHRARYVMIAATVPKQVRIERIATHQLPPDRRSAAGREQLQAIATDWIKRRSSAALAVPSSVIPAESNYLLNRKR